MIPHGLTLAQRLERCEASACTEFVEARARLMPEVGACWIEVAGAWASFDGPASPITQSFGLGMFAMPEPADMAQLEGFFHSRGAAAHHEVSPLAPKPLLELLAGRGYRPIELTDVMFLPLSGEALAPAAPAGIDVRRIGSEHAELWAKVSADGWREYAELADLLADLGRVSASRAGGLSFLAEKGGVPVATGAMFIHGGVALLAGASTVPEYRRQGAQRALLSARLAHATVAGCDLAMICTEPGSDSQRNALHCGFRIAYTRIKWMLPLP